MSNHPSAILIPIMQAALCAISLIAIVGWRWLTAMFHGG